MSLIPETITRPVTRIGAVAQNALEVARFGGLATDEEASPFEVAAVHRVYKLRHYFPRSNGTDAGPPVLLVPPMMLAADVYDVAPNSSAVTILREHGSDPWVTDFGVPEREEGGLERTLGDHVLAVSDAVDRVRELTGRDVHLGGYSQGGMFCYQAAALRRGDGIDSVITFGSPVDTRHGMPFGVPEQVAADAAELLADLFRGWSLPAWASRTGFRLLDPIKTVRGQIEFIMHLHDREALLRRERQRRFLEGEGWVAWPGPAMADFLRQFIAHNRMLEGGFVIEDRLVTLADISCPILAVVGTVDQIAPAAGVRAIGHAAPAADVYELAMQAGHFGLVVGSVATSVSWPAVAAWTRWRAGEGPLPEGVVPLSDDPSPELGTRVGGRVGYGVELAAGVGAGMARSVLGTATRAAKGVRELTREATGALPRLARLEQMQANTRISLGLVVEERRRKSPDEVLFLFEDRAYTAKEVGDRIDNVVRGLISIGIRQGEHVGVLMSTRPSALAAVVAISRLGAVSVLLRPDGDVRREVELGQVERIVADPEQAPLAAELQGVATYVLGGGGGPRELGLPVTADLEQIDPGAVELPRWYRPDPGTASSAALSGDDTVYSVTPPYHPSALMMSIGGAIAGGARLAMARNFDPSTFWEEVRRYGVTVVSYTWTLLHDLVEAPPELGERHHAVRLFIGSGMPPGLWRRVEERFAPARVLEFYASTEAAAILVNLRDVKRGAMGRPLPGSAEVRIAQYDIDAGGMVLDRDGFARPCAVGEVGMLLARVKPTDPLTVVPLRGVFEPQDAWLVTGDLFREDADGDYWRVDGVAEVIRAREGPVFTTPIRDALGELPAVDLAVAYGVRPRDQPYQLAVAAVTLRRGHELTAEEIGRAFAEAPREQRPAIVHVVDRIPVTTWYRPITAPLREAGIPEPSGGAGVWYHDTSGEEYQPLTAAVYAQLAGLETAEPTT
jgi:putative long chain acyl-CoA synthase